MGSNRRQCAAALFAGVLCLMRCAGDGDGAGPDGGSARDSGVEPGADAGVPDAGVPDAGIPDAGTPDAGTPDAGAPDAGVPDAGVPDAGVPDAGTPDAGTPDAGAQPLNWLTALDPFAPYGSGYGSPDFMDLFQPDASWPNAQRNIGVLKVYAGTTQSTSDADLQTMFQFLHQHGIALALEFGPITGTATCQGEGVEGASAATWNAQRIKALGGDLAYVAMDEPLNLFYVRQAAGTLSDCPFSTIDGLAQNVAMTVTAFRAEFPNVRVGDTESRLTAAQLVPWLDAYQSATGLPLAFFHDDALVESGGWQSEIASVRGLLTQRQIPYGLIRNGNCSNVAVTCNDVAWVADAVSRIQRVAGIEASTGLSPPQHNLFQTWDPYPHNVLPETSPQTLTFLVSYFSPPTASAQFDAAAAPVYRLAQPSGDELYSLSSTDGADAGYANQGRAFDVFTATSPTRSTLYRCRVTSGGDHFLSAVPNCEGQTVEVALGYVESTLSSGARNPLYRCRAGHHHQTPSPGECESGGMLIEGVLGFVP